MCLEYIRENVYALTKAIINSELYTTTEVVPKIQNSQAYGLFPRKWTETAKFKVPYFLNQFEANKLVT